MSCHVLAHDLACKGLRPFNPHSSNEVYPLDILQMSWGTHQRQCELLGTSGGFPSPRIGDTNATDHDTLQPLRRSGRELPPM